MPGTYSQIPSLVYSSVPQLYWGYDKYYVACAMCDAVTVREYMRTGVSVPGSPEFLNQIVAESDGPGGITSGHGFSSLRAGHTQLETIGSCPESLGPKKRLFGWETVNSTMKSAAAAHKIGRIAPLDYELLHYEDGIAYLKNNPGASFLVNAYGREGYVIVGVNTDGLAWWVDHNGRVGRPVVRSLSLSDGTAKFEELVKRGAAYGYSRGQYSLMCEP